MQIIIAKTLLSGGRRQRRIGSTSLHTHSFSEPVILMEVEPPAPQERALFYYSHSSLDSVFLQYLEEPAIYQYNNGRDDDRAP